MSQTLMRISNLLQWVLLIGLLSLVSISVFCQESNQSFLQEQSDFWRIFVELGVGVCRISQTKPFLSDESEIISFKNPFWGNIRTGIRAEKGPMLMSATGLLTGWQRTNKQSTYHENNNEYIIDWSATLGYGFRGSRNVFVRPFLSYHNTLVHGVWVTEFPDEEDDTSIRGYRHKTSSLGVGVTAIASSGLSLGYEWLYPPQGEVFTHHVFLGLQANLSPTPGFGGISIDLLWSGRAKYASLTMAVYPEFGTIGDRKERVRHYYNVGLR